MTRASEVEGDWEETTDSLEAPGASATGERRHGALVALSGNQSGAIYLLELPQVTIGRARTNTIWLTDDGLSRAHCRILRKADGYYLEDAGSTNGTACQGEAVVSPRKLEDGDRIAIGRDTLLRFSLQDEVEQHASRQTLELQIRDPLTRLPNRRHFDARLQAEFAFARRHGTPLGAIMIDLDNFKQVNDSHGHAAGDEVLRVVAQKLEHALRVEDTIGRYGGEEVGVLVRGIERDGVAALAERLRVAVALAEVAVDGARITVTASVGAVMLAPGHGSAEELVMAADRAMYEAKRRGRNCVVVG